MIREKIKEIANNIDKFKRKGDSFFYKKIEIQICNFLFYNDKEKVGGIILRIDSRRIKLENDEIKLINDVLQKEHDKLLQKKANEENKLLNSIIFGIKK